MLEELALALERLITRCNQSGDAANWDEVIEAEAVLATLYLAALYKC